MAVAKIVGSEYTADQVRRFFEIVGIDPISSEKKQTAAAGKQFTRKKAEADNPDTELSKRMAADEWIEAHNVVVTRFGNAIKLLKSGAFESADQWIDDWSEKEVNKLTIAARNELRNFIRDRWHLTDDFADQVVDDWMQDRGRAIDAPIATPSMVTDVKAVEIEGGCRLTWKRPASGFSEVEISRIRSDNQTATVVATTADSQLLDNGDDLQPGCRYRYSFKTIFRGTKMDQSVLSDEVLIPAKPVITAGPKWNGTAIQMSWTPAPGSSGTIVYRGEDGMPQSGQNPVPVDGAAITDSAVVEGKTYRYLVVPKYDEEKPGVMSDPVSVPARPKPPAKVEAVLTTPAPAAGNPTDATVTISWPKPVGHRAGDQFLVLRAAASQAIVRADQGRRIAETKELSAVDPKPPIAEECSYAVFTVREGSFTDRPAISNKVLNLPDVTNIRSQPGDARVELNWAANRFVTDVIVDRLEPKSPAANINVVNKTRAIDQGLRNGVRHRYRIRCKYALPGQVAMLSHGIETSEVPYAASQPVTDFRFEAEGDQLKVTCIAPPDSSPLRLLRSSRPLPYAFGSHESLDDLESIGQGSLTPVDGQPTVFRVSKPEANEYFTVISVCSPKACIGKTRQFHASRVDWHLIRPRGLLGRKPASEVCVKITGDPAVVQHIVLVAKVARRPSHAEDGHVVAEWKWDSADPPAGDLELPVKLWKGAKGREVWCKLFSHSRLPVDIRPPDEHEGDLI